jgi:hypothetical protein
LFLCPCRALSFFPTTDFGIGNPPPKFTAASSGVRSASHRDAVTPGSFDGGGVLSTMPAMSSRRNKCWP